MFCPNCKRLIASGLLVGCIFCANAHDPHTEHEPVARQLQVKPVAYLSTSSDLRELTPRYLSGAGQSWPDINRSSVFPSALTNPGAVTKLKI